MITPRARRFLALLGAGFAFITSAFAASLSITSGQPLTFSVAVEGTPPFSYQWRKDGAAIPGATDETYSIGSPTLADSGNYTVAIANPAGLTISDVAALTVTSPVFAPSIAAQPVSRSVAPNQGASFSVAAVGSAPLSYQWCKNGTPIFGAVSSSYAIKACNGADAGTYSVVVFNSVDAVTSADALLTVASSSEPGDLTPTTYSSRGEHGPNERLDMLFDGQTATKWLDFSGNTWVRVWFASPVSLQSYSFTSANDSPERDPCSWTLLGSNDGVIWTAVDSCTGHYWSSRSQTNTFTFSTATAPYQHFLFNITAAAGTVTQIAELSLRGISVANSISSPPAITSHPASLTVTAGQPASFSVTSGGTAPLSYRWSKNGVPIPGATSATYSIGTTAAGHAGGYSVVISNAVGSASSSVASLIVNPRLTSSNFTFSYSARGENSPGESLANLFDDQPGSKWLDFSSSTWVQIVAEAPTSLQAYSLTSANDSPERDPSSWILSGSNDGTTWTMFESRSGQFWSSRLQTREFTLTTPSTAYRYFRFDLLATAGTVTQLAELCLRGMANPSTPPAPPPVDAPAIVSPPAALTIDAGESATFSVTASGSALSYQWRKDGSPISGATSTSYTIATALPADSGNYSVVVSNSGGSVASPPAALVVNAASSLVTVTPVSCSARGQNGSIQGVANLFDGLSVTKWVDFSGTTWVQITLAAPTSISAYSLTSADDAPERDPVSWTLSGANDGGTWATIESRSGESWSRRIQTHDFVLAVPSTAYRYLRFDLQATPGAITQLAELELYASTGNAVQLTPSLYSARGQGAAPEGVAQLFDGQSSTKWLDHSASTWVQIMLSAPANLERYALVSANDAPERDPAAWTLSGSNDGVTWMAIETRSGQSWSNRSLSREFGLASPTARYSRYRFDFQATSGTTMQLAELLLFGVMADGSYTPPVPTTTDSSSSSSGSSSSSSSSVASNAVSIDNATSSSSPPGGGGGATSPLFNLACLALMLLKGAAIYHRRRSRLLAAHGDR